MSTLSLYYFHNISFVLKVEHSGIKEHKELWRLWDFDDVQIPLCMDDGV